MKRMLIVSVTLFLIVFVLLGVKYSDYREKSFEETLEIHPDHVKKVSIGVAGEYRSTTDEETMEELFQYFESVQYKRLIGDKTAYMPMNASIIYLYGDDHIDFIVPYNDEAMISYKVYKVKEGTITNTFIYEFYETLVDDHSIRDDE